MYKRKIDNRWDFREADTKEFTHGYNTYPAMMIPQVARTLIEEYKPEGKFNLLFDPYMGSGTSLIEANIIGVDSIGTDINPLARMIAEAKVTHYDSEEISELIKKISNKCSKYKRKLVKNTDFSRISNYSFWYNEESLYKLSYLSQIVDSFPKNCRLFFEIAISEVVRDVSFTRNGEFKRYRMSESNLLNFNPDVFELFLNKLEKNFNGLCMYNKVEKKAKSLVCGFDSSVEIPTEIIKKDSVDMVVTSPPYGDSGTTVAYGQFSRWANEWFGFSEAKNLDRMLMGGKKTKEVEFETKSIKDTLETIKKLDEKRYWEVVSFLNDYWRSIKNVSETVRNGGVVCYVVGNRTVKEQQIPLDYFTAEMFEKCGFKHIITIVRDIPNKRMPSKTSPTNKKGNHVTTMKNEYIVILKKK